MGTRSISHAEPLNLIPIAVEESLQQLVVSPPQILNSAAEQSSIITVLHDVPPPVSHLKRASGDTQVSFDLDVHKRHKLNELASKISVNELVILELCAGSANLSSEFRSLGFQVLPIDHKGNAHHQKVRTILIDLSAPTAFGLVQTILRAGNIYYVHMGPPCGTASAARNKAVPWHLVRQGAPSPPPLRSLEHPLGFPWLSGVSRDRVLSANRIYSLCAEVAKLCMELDIILSIENPLNSLFWAIPFIAALVSNPMLEWVVFQACMHGSTRNKWTAWLSTKGVFSSMAMRCDGSHSHEGWNLIKRDGKWQFDTATEAEYPRQLCATAAQLVLSQAVDSGYASLPVDIQGVFTERQRRLWKRATTGKLTRGRALPQLVSEFMSITETVESQVIPKECRLLRRFWRKGENAASDSPSSMISIVGTWRRTPEKFVEEALCVQHPYDSLVTVPDQLKTALYNILSLGPVGITKKRTQAVQELNASIKRFELEERVLHSRLDPHCKKIMASQKFLLFKHLLEQTDYGDKTLVDDIMRGFDLVGCTLKSTVLPSRFLPATISPGELLNRSKWATPLLLAQCKSCGEESLDKEVYRQTLEQRDAHWLRGPFTKQQVDKLFPEGWTVSRRFGLQQGDKVRVIDDAKQPGINHALSTCEKLALMDTDDTASLLRLIMDSFNKDSKSFSIPLSSGEILTGTVHPLWYKNDRMDWSGRTLDLESAYKHLCNSPSTRWAAVLAAYNPATQQPDLFVSDSLMFGSTSAV